VYLKEPRGCGLVGKRGTFHATEMEFRESRLDWSRADEKLIGIPGGYKRFYWKRPGASQRHDVD